MIICDVVVKKTIFKPEHPKTFRAILERVCEVFPKKYMQKNELFTNLLATKIRIWAVIMFVTLNTVIAARNHSNLKIFGKIFKKSV